MNGVVIIDKAGGLTSHDVVNRVRRILGLRSVGHLGTLDPAATGVLPVVVGNFTRLAKFYLKSEKEYEGVIRFGFSTTTYDAEGEPTSATEAVTLRLPEVGALAREFTGSLQQVPPPFSAKKIAGVPAYKMARKNQEVRLQPVRVEIKEFEILRVDDDRATFRARVGSGTYIRSVAHDMGKKMGCGAHLAALRRTAVGEFTIDDAHTIDELDCFQRKGSAEQLFIHSRKLLPHMPCVTATEENAAMIRSGRSVNLPEMSRAPLVKVFCGQTELIAIATRIAGTLFHPGIVFRSNDDWLCGVTDDRIS
jgi:tRNA pseudouridine55 synthase